MHKNCIKISKLDACLRNKITKSTHLQFMVRLDCSCLKGGCMCLCVASLTASLHSHILWAIISADDVDAQATTTAIVTGRDWRRGERYTGLGLCVAELAAGISALGGWMPGLAAN